MGKCQLRKVWAAAFPTVMLLGAALSSPALAGTLLNPVESDAGQPGDAGDSPTSARLIAAGGHDGILAFPDDVSDWYAFYATRGQLIRLNLSSGVSNFDLVLYDSGFRYRANSIATQLQEDHIFIPVDVTGYWKVLVYTQGLIPLSAGDIGAYTLDLEIQPFPQDDGASGYDAPGHYFYATEVPKPITDGELRPADGDTEDWYRLFLDVGDIVDATISAAPPLSASLRLTKPNLNTAAEVTSCCGNSASFRHYATQAGDWKLLVKSSPVSGAGLYSLYVVITRPIPQNDSGLGRDAAGSLATADEILPGNHTGTLEPIVADTEDWYKVNVTAGENLTYVLESPVGADFDLRLYNATGTLVNASYAGPGVLDKVINNNLPAGFYRLRLMAVTGFGNYTSTLILD